MKLHKEVNMVVLINGLPTLEYPGGDYDESSPTSPTSSDISRINTPGGIVDPEYVTPTSPTPVGSYPALATSPLSPPLALEPVTKPPLIQIADPFDTKEIDLSPLLELELPMVTILATWLDKIYAQLKVQSTKGIEDRNALASWLVDHISFLGIGTWLANNIVKPGLEGMKLMSRIVIDATVFSVVQAVTGELPSLLEVGLIGYTKEEKEWITKYVLGGSSVVGPPPKSWSYGILETKGMITTVSNTVRMMQSDPELAAMKARDMLARIQGFGVNLAAMGAIVGLGVVSKYLITKSVKKSLEKIILAVIGGYTTGRVLINYWKNAIPPVSPTVPVVPDIPTPTPTPPYVRPPDITPPKVTPPPFVPVEPLPTIPPLPELVMPPFLNGVPDDEFDVDETRKFRPPSSIPPIVDNVPKGIPSDVISLPHVPGLSTPSVTVPLPTVPLTTLLLPDTNVRLPSGGGSGRPMSPPSVPPYCMTIIRRGDVVPLECQPLFDYVNKLDPTDRESFLSGKEVEIAQRIETVTPRRNRPSYDHGRPKTVE
jgi:hypothetical protein